jgi:hypothetical protein
LGLALLVLAPVIAGVTWWLRPGDPVAVLRAHAPIVTAVTRERLDGSGLERWRMATARGDTLSGLWKPAAGVPVSKAWSVVLLGGLETGERAATLIPDSLPVAVLAMDWPWPGRHTMQAHQIAAATPAIRRAVLSSPGTLAAGLFALALTGEAAPARIAVVGVSLGVPPAVAALALEPSPPPAALALVDGAADLTAMLDRGLLRERIPSWLVGPAARLGARLIHPLEPALHGHTARHLPVLIINARDDARLPPHGIHRLHAAFPTAEVRWREGTHVDPAQHELIASIAHEVHAWIEETQAGGFEAGKGRMARSAR